MKKLLILLLLLAFSCSSEIETDKAAETRQAKGEEVPLFGTAFLSTAGWQSGRTLCQDNVFTTALYHNGQNAEPEILDRISTNFDLSLELWLDGDNLYYKAPNNHVILVNEYGVVVEKYACP
jgi:hypothetical protein